jgi:hypothetical protein
MAGPNQLWGNQDGSDTNSSRDCFIEPITGGVNKRPGCAVLGDTLSSGVEVNGLLNAKWGARSRRFFALDSPSMSDGYPAQAILFSEDTNAGFPAADSGFPGTVYVRSSNGGGANYSLLEEFGSTHYKPTFNALHTTSDYNLKVVPIWYESGDGVYTRGALTGASGADKFMQQFVAAGSRSIVQTQNWLYSYGLRHSPWRWNKRLNESDSSGSEVVRIWPAGPVPPLYPPQFDSTALSASANNSSWVDGDTFCISVAFRFEDGSVSAPFIPRLPNSTLTNGLGLVTVGTIGGANKYQFLTYRCIPIGPHGTVERILLRTPKQNRTATTDTITVEPTDLRVLGVLKNNTQTTYRDYNGDDDTLVEDEDTVRVDFRMPPRARYAGTGDNSVILGYTLPNTAAIVLSLINVAGATTSNFDLNDADDETIGTTPYNARAALVRITSTQLELHYNNNAAPDFVAGGGGDDNAVAFAFSTYDTLEKLVDAINATTSSSLCKQWAAQILPGIDPTMPSASLTLTTMDIACGTTDTFTTVTSAGLFGPVGVGMKVSGTGITAGTYVVSKASASSLTISSAATATGSPTLTFYQETGDNGIVTGGTLGYMRCFGPNLPLVLCMKPSAFPGYDKADTQSVYFTMASPGALASGVSLAPNSFLGGNRVQIPAPPPNQKMRRAINGVVDIEGAGLITCTNGIFMFKNFRGGNSGEDFDRRMYTINNTRGCISYLGLVAGNGWAAYPTTEGICVTDKNGREFIISGSVFSATDNTGDLAYELKTSAASAASDSEDQYLSMAVIGSKLAVAYRASGDSVGRVLFYDFSPGVEASGVEELINPETKSAYIWSPPAAYNAVHALGPIGAMGSVAKSDGRFDYICTDSNNGSTGDGRLDRINTGSQDNGFNYNAYATVSPVVPTPFMAIMPVSIEATHLTAGVAATLFLANDQDPTFSAGMARSFNVDSNRTQYQKQTIPLDIGIKGKTDMFWMQWRGAAASNTTDRFWRLVLRYNEVENFVGMNDLV